MNVYVLCVTVAVFVLAFITNGDALRCWKCSSDAYGRCADHFNVTLFPRYQTIQNAYSDSPHIIDCERDVPNNYQTYSNFGGYQRHVCMKKVITDRRTQRKIYSRGCHLLVGNEAVGTCTNQQAYGDDQVDFCEYCDTFECNGAQGLQKNLWVGLIPIAVALILRK
ncbi:hypothetical protein ILUMI_08781 [Ignelater luminosus]|uniref:Protein sleepless n=1 Tax=Ignelater luminosus TaxID=2038154 RepID=A0A8K0GF44_IGNLU|nr:hypothetical protein ILUMI_08781 [Ignelater luminosus]